MTIRVKLFASLAESMGWRETTLDYRPEFTLAEVWSACAAGKPLPNGILIALNMRYCSPVTLVADGDEIAFFPPVTGG